MHGNQHALNILCASLNVHAARRRHWFALLAWCSHPPEKPGNTVAVYAARVELRRLGVALNYLDILQCAQVLPETR